MNILFHLIPKEKVAYIEENATLRQAMEKMEHHRYTAVPILDKKGKYIGVLREGDILWYIKNLKVFNQTIAEKIKVSDLPRIKDHLAVSIAATLEPLIDLSIEQNFIPVTDDHETFIGIVTRKSIISHLNNNYLSIKNEYKS